jgi:enamine deaminase RidA (YjgF/YER057c/UK114 family)
MAESKPAQARQYYSPDPQAQRRAFSRAVVTAGGRTIWLAGQTASGPDVDFDSQVREVFAKLDRTITGAGGNGLADMVTMTVFIKDARLGDRFVELRGEIFKERFPASALITVAGFARPEILVEVQGVAVVDE